MQTLTHAYRNQLWLRSRRLWALPLLVWLGIIGASLAWNVHALRQSAYVNFLHEARTLTQVALSTMAWAQLHGQVFLPLSEWIPKEPFFADLPQRDVVTVDGMRLTPVTPGAIVLQQAERSWLLDFTRKSVRVVSALNADSATAASAPDPWEHEALNQFQNGESERFERVGVEEAQQFRFMAPIKAPPADDPLALPLVVGGVSVSVNARERLAEVEPQVRGMVATHAGVFVLVSLGMVFLFSRLRAQALVLQRINDEQKKTIAELAESELRLEEMSMSDELTGLRNRRGFFKLAAEKLHDAPAQRLNYCMVFVDLDGMKRINDQLGHDEGDRALVATARILQATFRSTDVLARLGGDEFVVLMVCSAESKADHLLERLQANLEQHNRASGAPYPLSFSLGLIDCHACCDNACGLDDLLQRADAVMYENKRRKKLGRGQVPVQVAQHSAPATEPPAPQPQP
jgi:diguanylate cyclase (GGDEF)-like protein